MTISRVLLLIIGQNDINPKLLQPIVASICKVMTVKKPCVPFFEKILKILFIGLLKWVKNFTIFFSLKSLILFYITNFCVLDLVNLKAVYVTDPKAVYVIETPSMNLKMPAQTTMIELPYD